MKKIFPFKYIAKNYFGSVFRPYAKILVRKLKTPKVWLEREMIVDTGADYTLFPKNDAYIFGIDLAKNCYLQTTFGIGGEESVYLYKSLPMKIGKWKKKIPVGFLKRNDIPPLLGRQEFLESLKVNFEDLQTIFYF